MSHRTRDRRRDRTDTGFAARRRRVAEVLRRLGLWEAFERSALPPAARDLILSQARPKPAVVLADRLTADREAEGVRQELEGVLGAATFRCPPFPDPVPVVEYFATVKPVADLLASLAVSRGPAGRSPLADAARPFAARLASLDTGAYACEAACHALGFQLMAHNRIDRGVYWVAVAGDRTDRGRWRLVLRLDREPARAEAVVADGVGRRAYRVGVPTLDGVRWAAWDPAAVGLDWPAGVYPVLVQRHALDALYGPGGRLAGFDAEWVFHEWLVRSLAAPAVRPDPAAPHRGLVEYAVGGTRLGYLVAERVGGAVLVRTFLFLTMDGTPEAAALLRRLRLGGADRRYLGLDDVRTFLTTDLGADPELARALAACGCGPLLEWAACDEFGEKAAGRAAEVRRYLGLTR